MAEGEGFEPSVACATSVFKTGALNQTLPPLRVEIDLREIRRLCKSQNKDFSKWVGGLGILCSALNSGVGQVKTKKAPSVVFFLREGRHFLGSERGKAGRHWF